MGSRRDTVLLIALLVIILTLSMVAGRNQPPSRFDPRASTYLSSPAGAQALYEVLRELKIPVDRRRAPLADADSIAGPLVLLGPTEPLTPRELGALAAWVRGGGTLLYAPPLYFAFRDEVADTLGLRLVTLEPARETPRPRPGRREGPDTTVSYEELMWTGAAATATGHRLAEGVGVVEGFRRAFVPAGPLRGAQAEVLLASGGRPVAAAYPLGRGRVVAFSDAAPFVNQQLKTSRGAVLFARVAADATAGGRTLRFDEYHHGFQGDGSVVRTLRRFFVHDGAGRALLQLAAVALGLLLLAGRRFGAAVPPAPARRRSPLEHVEALAGAYRQAGARRTARRFLLAGLARRLGRRVPREGDESVLLAPLSHHAGAGESARALETEWKKGGAADLVALSRNVDQVLEEVRKP